MPLSKGFLRPPLRFVGELRSRLIHSTILWISFSYLLYAFGISIREVIRLMISLTGSREPMILSPTEGYFFNFFYSSLSLSVSFGFVFHFFWSSPLIRPRNVRFSKRFIMTDHHNVNLFALFLFAKLGLFYGLFCPVTPLFLRFSFSDHMLLLLLFPLVIFILQWTTINRIFLLRGLKWMFFALTVLIVLSLIFAALPFMNDHKIDKWILSNTPAGRYEWELPPRHSEAIEKFKEWRQYMNLKIYAGFPVGKVPSEQVVFMGVRPYDPLDETTFPETVSRLRDEAENNFGTLTAQLFIDRRTPMKKVKEIKRLLFSSGVRTAFLALRNEDAMYGIYNRSYFRQRLYYCDSSYHVYVDYENSTGGIPAPYYPERVTAMPGLTVLLKSGRFFVNGVTETAEEIRARCSGFVAAHAENGYVRLWADDVSAFEDYLIVYNSILAGYNDVADEYAMKTFGVSYRESLGNPFNSGSRDVLDAVTKKYPRYFVDLSDDEVKMLIKNIPSLKPYFEGE